MSYGGSDGRPGAGYPPRPGQGPNGGGSVIDQTFSPPPGPPPGRGGGNDYGPPAGAPPGRENNPYYAAPSGPPPARYDGYAPPPGLPPSGHSSQYAPPSGPPPGRSNNPYYSAPSGPPPGQYGDFAPPSGPPPGQHGDFAPPSGPPPGQHGNFAPPAGPPPSQRNDGYAPPQGPPPSYQGGQYAPPPGPPPASEDWIRPPPGPPPSDSKPQHNWEVAVPDTSLFPPPPAIFSGLERSPTSNASEEEATAGTEWCERYPMVQPMVLDQVAQAALEVGNIRLIEPAGFNGKLNWLGQGLWQAETAKNTPDRCIIGYPPLYVVNNHDPTRYGRPKTIYFEVKIRPDSRNVFVGLGFTALPYPSFRMPGWHRGSLAVHGDDGNKYINDIWGGKEFTSEFRRGETYGIGMTFRPPARGGSRPDVNVFFTRNGAIANQWDLHEETDAEQDMPVTGLEGFHDLSCAIGTYDGVSFEGIFDPARWKYRPQM